MKKVWKKITVTTDTQGSELTADAFFSIGLNGVEIQDKNDIKDIIKQKKMWDYIDESLITSSPDFVKVSGFIAEENITEKLKELKEILKLYGINGDITITDINDDTWYENWKKFYTPIVAGSFVITPEWLEYENKDNLIEIKIDPGMAFGTGEHETTRMCLELMSELNFHNKSVIDIGCGSGILGIAALKKGAKSCYMSDIDSVAVKAAKANAKLNNINAQIELADIFKKKDIKADIILANLTADLLIKLYKDIRNYIEKGGIAILSGIINDRTQETLTAYLSQGFSLIRKLSLGEWTAFSAEVKWN
ncbi:MAG: 50S ribosomal protein L11 methyltransferase [Bacillota bacterium]|jgi:ribosomal protein L11 methyltransferase|nr:50S ribosomal protein L11 methyltransferase [Bacillota bacterium]HHU43608.1 50S ribosomal protein L11 methyltransferase [Clostridiales bacterium]